MHLKHIEMFAKVKCLITGGSTINFVFVGHQTCGWQKRDILSCFSIFLSKVNYKIFKYLCTHLPLWPKPPTFGFLQG